MNDEDRGILVGMILGDGYISVKKRVNAKGKLSIESASLSITHSVKQRLYVEHKCELVRKIFGGTHTVHERRARLKNGKTYQLYGFIKTNPYFRILRKMLYHYGAKTFTSQALNMLTPHGIAIWYMDDGTSRINVNSKGFISSVATEIATCCSYEEAILICAWFKEKHDIAFKPFSTKESFSIRCNTENSHVFARMIEPYIIPSMRYKLSHVADLNLHERQATVGVCEKCGSPIYAQRRGKLCNRCYSVKRYWETDRIKAKRKFYGPRNHLLVDDIVRTGGKENYQK